MESETRTEVAARITISKANLTSAVAACKDDCRPVLSGLAIDHTGTTATDGRTLVHIAPRNVEADASEVPMLILAPEVVKALRGNSETVVSSDGNGGVNTAGENGIASYPHGVIDGQYPDWAKVVPTEEPVIKIGIDLAILHRTLHALSVSISDKRVVPATVSLYGVKRPIKIETTIGEEQEALALVMPRQLEA